MTAVERITSDQNPLLKLTRRLIESSRDRRKHKVVSLLDKLTGGDWRLHFAGV